MDVKWLEQTEADVPVDNYWLSKWERLFLSRMRFPKRRADWRLGRWTAKQALAAYLNLPANLDTLADFEIRPAPSGAPEVLLHDQPAAVAISLTHRAGAALCTLGSPELNFGCDLETVEPRSGAFIADYFTTSERALIEQASAKEKPQLTALLWSAKESTLKALRLGLRLDTRCVSVSLAERSRSSANPDGWHRLQVSYESTQVFAGWWRLTDNLIRTIVSGLQIETPIRIRSGKFIQL